MANIQKVSTVGGRGWPPSHTLPPDQLGRFAPSLSVPPHFSEAADALGHGWYN